MTETYVKEEVAWRTMVKVTFSNSCLERRDARQKFSESVGAGASLAPRTRQRVSLGSENGLEIQAPELSELESVELELGSCCSDFDKQVWDERCRTRKRQFEIPFCLSARHAPEWLRARFLPVVFLANEEELTRKTFTTFLNTTNLITYVKFIFLRTSPLR